MSIEEGLLAKVQQLSIAEVGSVANMRTWLAQQGAPLLSLPENTSAFVLVHAVQAVQMGLLTSSGLDTSLDTVLDPALVQEVRIFNLSGELHLWRNKNGFAYRLLQEPVVATNSKTKFKYDCTCYLWGNRLEADGHTLIDQDRGMRIVLPVAGKPGAYTYATYTVHNYLGYDCDGQVKLLDARLVSIDVKPEGGNHVNI